MMDIKQLQQKITDITIWKKGDQSLYFMQNKTLNEIEPISSQNFTTYSLIYTIICDRIGA